MACNSLGLGGAGNESNENVEPVSVSASGGGGSENIESVMHDGITSSGLNGDASIRSSLFAMIMGT